MQIDDANKLVGKRAITPHGTGEIVETYRMNGEPKIRVEATTHPSKSTNGKSAVTANSPYDPENVIKADSNLRLEVKAGHEAAWVIRLAKQKGFDMSPAGRGIDPSDVVYVNLTRDTKEIILDTDREKATTAPSFESKIQFYQVGLFEHWIELHGDSKTSSESENAEDDKPPLPGAGTVWVWKPGTDEESREFVTDVAFEDGDYVVYHGPVDGGTVMFHTVDKWAHNTTYDDQHPINNCPECESLRKDGTNPVLICDKHNPESKQQWDEPAPEDDEWLRAIREHVSGPKERCGYGCSVVFGPDAAERLGLKDGTDELNLRDLIRVLVEEIVAPKLTATIENDTFIHPAKIPSSMTPPPVHPPNVRGSSTGSRDVVSNDEPKIDKTLKKWRVKACANINKWGLQDSKSLLVDMMEELGELSQAVLEYKAESGDYDCIQDELDDLAPLMIQFQKFLDLKGVDKGE